MAIKVKGTTVIDDNYNIVSGSIQHQIINTGNIIDLTLGQYFVFGLASGIGTTITFIPPNTTGYYAFVLEVNNYGGTSISWPSNVYWAGGSAPALVSNNKHVYSFTTKNGGGTWYASAVMNYSTAA